MSRLFTAGGLTHRASRLVAQVARRDGPGPDRPARGARTVLPGPIPPRNPNSGAAQRRGSRGTVRAAGPPAGPAGAPSREPRGATAPAVLTRASRTRRGGTSSCHAARVMAAKWILRKGGPKGGFRYVHEDGRAVRDAGTIARIEAIRIPPAWRDVHVAASSTLAIQAWGYDARGRRQYRYHDRAYEKGQLRKYYRVRMLAKELPRVRAILARDSARRTPTRDAVAALVVRLISEGYFRVGGDRAEKENRTFGITTMRKTHVQCEDGQVVFRYVGKGGKKQRQVIANRELARAVERVLKTPGSRLFQWKDQDGWHALGARDVNAYIHERIGPSYTAKDFRTWGGTLRAATVLAELGPARSPTEAKRNVAMAMRLVAADLGNTPTICRTSYVHPMVVARYLDEGETIRLDRRRGRHAVRHGPEERALIAFLDRHFPERRRKPRPEAA